MAQEVTETYSMDILSVLSEISDKLSTVISKLNDLESVTKRIQRNQESSM